MRLKRWEKKFKSAYKIILIWGGYTVLSKIIFVASLKIKNDLLGLAIPWVYGATAACIFLYFLMHDETFGFVKKIEKKELREEKKLAHHFKHASGLALTFISAIVSGPVLAAFIVRFLMHRFHHKYLLLWISLIPSTLVWVGSARGIFKLLFH